VGARGLTWWGLPRCRIAPREGKEKARKRTKKFHVKQGGKRCEIGRTVRKRRHKRAPAAPVSRETPAKAPKKAAMLVSDTRKTGGCPVRRFGGEIARKRNGRPRREGLSIGLILGSNGSGKTTMGA
jgi:hypothetical protein